MRFTVFLPVVVVGRVRAMLQPPVQTNCDLLVVGRVRIRGFRRRNPGPIQFHLPCCHASHTCDGNYGENYRAWYSARVWPSCCLILRNSAMMFFICITPNRPCFMARDRVGGGRPQEKPPPPYDG